MPSIFSKLDLTTQKCIVVLNAPESFEPELSSLQETTVIRNLEEARSASFWLAFVTEQADVDHLTRAIISKSKSDGTNDPIIWLAFIKGSSKLSKGKITRDKGWDVLRESGFDTVRSVAMDKDWSALRFRDVQFIKR